MSIIAWMIVPLLIIWLVVVPCAALIAFAVGIGSPSERRPWLASSAVLFALWVPLMGDYLGVWQLSWIFPVGEIRSTVVLPDYRVEFVSNAYSDDISEHFEVVRADGKQGFVYIDGDANRCADFHTRQEGTRIYFVCGTDPTPSYVDTAQAILFSEYTETTTRLADIKFEEPERE